MRNAEAAGDLRLNDTSERPGSRRKKRAGKVDQIREPSRMFV